MGVRRRKAEKMVGNPPRFELVLRRARGGVGLEQLASEGYEGDSEAKVLTGG